MTLRASHRPLRPDLDRFLFATVGAEQDGVPLSMVSALTRLGLDPWEEAGRLSSLNKREAIEQLARLIAELPGICLPLQEAREIAGGLVEQLPRHDGDRPATRRAQLRRLPAWLRAPTRAQLLMLCLVTAAAALISVVLNG